MMVVDGDQREGISRHRLVFRFIASASFSEIKKVLSHHWDKTENPAVPPKLTHSARSFHGPLSVPPW